MLPELVLMMMAAAPTPPQPPAQFNLTPPSPTGAPHACVENTYPISALQTGTEGSTILAFVVTPQGNVASISVAGSSGNAALDTASLACASAWTYRPAMKDGVAVESPWKARVVWQIDSSALFDDIDVAGYRCLAASDTMHEKVNQGALHTVVRVHFWKGTFANVAVVASSGDPDLDNYVQACYVNMPPSLATNIPDGDQLFVAMLGPGE